MGAINIYDLHNFTRNNTSEYTFVESGTFYGDAVEHVRANYNFKEIHSIEIVIDLAKRAQERFYQYPHINIHCGASKDILPKILSEIDNNIVFWLDAHFPGADAGLKGYADEEDDTLRIPLKTELEYIAQRKKKYADIIILDDLWLYEDGPFDWGTFNEHMQIHHKGEKREEICKHNIRKIIQELFSDTHIPKTVTQLQGSIILFPKNL